MDNTLIRQHLLKFKNARGNLLMMVAFTAVNLLLQVLGTDVYLLFSATAPPFAYVIGQVLTEEHGEGIFVGIGLAVAAVILALYLLCWLLSGRYRGGMLAALLLFIGDSAFLLWLGGFDASSLLDIGFHIWVLFYLFTGTMAWWQLRRVPPEAIAEAQQGIAAQARTDAGGFLPVTPNATPLRPEGDKGRILVEADYNNLQIALKRSWGLTELIVNGYVYDEKRGLMEVNYTLAASVRGADIVARYDSVRAHTYIYVDGQQVAKKLRLF